MSQYQINVTIIVCLLTAFGLVQVYFYLLFRQKRKASTMPINGSQELYNWIIKAIPKAKDHAEMDALNDMIMLFVDLYSGDYDTGDMINNMWTAYDEKLSEMKAAESLNIVYS